MCVLWLQVNYDVFRYMLSTYGVPFLRICMFSQRGVICFVAAVLTAGFERQQQAKIISFFREYLTKAYGLAYLYA